MDEFNRIYARPNADGVVIEFFSEAFATPTSNDVCVDEINTDRHGAQSYIALDEHNIANYEIIDGKLVERDKTEEFAKVIRECSYPTLVDKLIREKYDVSAEFAVIRQRDTKPDEFIEYNAFCEECKEKARAQLGISI